MLNKLLGWVDIDFAGDVDTRKSMTVYLMSVNGGPIKFLEVFMSRWRK